MTKLANFKDAAAWLKGPRSRRAGVSELGVWRPCKISWISNADFLSMKANSLSIWKCVTAQSFLPRLFQFIVRKLKERKKKDWMGHPHASDKTTHINLWISISVNVYRQMHLHQWQAVIVLYSYYSKTGRQLGQKSSQLLNPQRWREDKDLYLSHWCICAKMDVIN